MLSGASGHSEPRVLPPPVVDTPSCPGEYFLITSGPHPYRNLREQAFYGHSPGWKIRATFLYRTLARRLPADVPGGQHLTASASRS